MVAFFGGGEARVQQAPVILSPELKEQAFVRINT